MDRIAKETIKVRVISVGLICVALAIFKPMGIGRLGVWLYAHLLIIWVLGTMVCNLSGAIVNYLVGMPPSLAKGVDYIIKRNLWFQIINTPLEALMICLYLHFALIKMPGIEPLSLSGLIQMLIIIAFCSFLIGLYWRYKYRSRYLTAELEETRQLNSELTRIQEVIKSRLDEADETQIDYHEQGVHSLISSKPVTLVGSTSETVTLNISDILYIESDGNYQKVYYLVNGTVRSQLIRSTSKQIEADLIDYGIIVRCHRAFLVNLMQVEEINSRDGSMKLTMRHCHDFIPISRSNMARIKKALASIKSV